MAGSDSMLRRSTFASAAVARAAIMVRRRAHRTGRGIMADVLSARSSRIPPWVASCGPHSQRADRAGKHADLSIRVVVVHRCAYDRVQAAHGKVERRRIMAGHRGVDVALREI